MAEQLNIDPNDPLANADQAQDIGTLIRETVEDIADLRKRRKHINDQINELRSGLKAAGLNLKAFDDAVKRREIDDNPETAANFDRTMRLCAAALKTQLDLPLGEDAGDEVRH